VKKNLKSNIYKHWALEKATIYLLYNGSASLLI